VAGIDDRREHRDGDGMLTRRLHALRSAPADGGMTLIELMVGMGLMTIIGAMGVNFIVSATSQASRTLDASFATANGRTAMTTVVSELRLADTPTAQAGYPTGRFQTMTAGSIVFYANLATTARAGSASRNPPAMVSISATGGKLVQKVYWPKSTTVPADYTTNYATTPSSTNVLLNTLGNTDVFTYCTTATDPATTCTPTTVGESVASVGIKLVMPGLNGETTQTLQSTVAITGAVS
jgi:type II secretory pathway pseudopilin PulG